MAKPLKGKRRLTKEQRHEQLLGCAIHVAAKKGLGQLVHADIAAEAGVVVANVFRYFPSRHELIRSVVDEVGRFYRKQSDECHASDAPVAEVLKNNMVVFSNSIDEKPDYAAVWLQWNAAVQNDCGIWDMLQEHNDHLISNIARTLTRSPAFANQEPELTRVRAHVLLGNAFTLTILKFSSAPDDAIERFMSSWYFE